MVLGGGQRKQSLVTVGQHRVQISSRMGLFKTDVGVVLAPDEFAGMIVVPHWEEIQKLLAPGQAWRTFVWKPEHRVYQLVRSVYAAYRQTWHILQKYGLDVRTGEKSAMTTAAQAARQLNLVVLGLARGSSVEQVRQATSRIVQQAAGQLGQPRRLTKLQAVEQLAALNQGGDRQGRFNPSAAMARTQAAYRLLQERLEQEIMVIDPHIESRQKALINMIQLAELRLGAIGHFLQSLLSGNTFYQWRVQRQRMVIAAQCEYYAQDCATIDFHPYRQTCQEIATDLRRVRDLLRQGRDRTAFTKEARHALINCREALSLKAVQIDVERLIFRVMRAEQRPRRFAWSQARVTLEGIDRRLRSVDESHFRRPVSIEARVRLEKAWVAIRAADQAQLAALRQTLKEMSDVL
ncbi:MAG: hypothetical protein HY092_01900 [Candidatus Kerfeldbacteria bacterium]|nr:hypothetical protein [Candidatus Kerfeldbacteria bacterium]